MASAAMQQKRAAYSVWTRVSSPPVLADGEIGWDITNNQARMGNGSSLWASLPIIGSASSSFTGGTIANALTITAANNTADGGGQLYINGATGNRIDFASIGVAAPTFTTRSTGTKIVLYPNMGASTVDYAIGISSNTLWNSVPNSTATNFSWYAGTTLVANLTGAGTLTTSAIGLTGGLSLSGSLSPISLNSSVGTSGQVLTSAGAGATPTWSTPTISGFNGSGTSVTGVQSAAGVALPISTSTVSTGNSGAISITTGTVTGTSATTGAVSIATGDGASSGAASGAITIKTGAGSGSSGPSGSITIDAGTPSGGSSAGSITIGGTNASAITIGRSSFATTVAGTLTATPTAGTTSTGATGAGYMGLPQNSATTGTYTITAADAGTHIYSTATRTINIPTNATLALPIGTTLTFVALTGATVTISCSDTNALLLAGTTTAGTNSRTLPGHGIATAIKITATTWMMSGNGSGSGLA